VTIGCYTVTSLQELLYVREREIYSLDMSVSIKKSSCMHIGPKFNDVKSANIITTEGNELTRSDTIRCLGVYIVSAKMFCCVFKEAKPVLSCF